MDQYFHSISARGEKCENIEENIDNVQVECNRSEDVSLFRELELSVLAADNHLGIINQVEAEEDDTDDADSHVHGWTPDQEKEQGGCHENEAENVKETTAHREVSL